MQANQLHTAVHTRMAYNLRHTHIFFNIIFTLILHNLELNQFCGEYNDELHFFFHFCFKVKQIAGEHFLSFIMRRC